MSLKLDNIDHVHVYVSNWADAEAWYSRILHMRRVEALMPWAIKNGPLTIENSEGTIHLALFEVDDHPGTSAIAFGVDADGFMRWKNHLEAEGLKLRITDHKLAYSLYFSDPWENLHEITTYERDAIADKLAS